LSAAELKAKVERELEEDRLFLRKLKPSVIVARARRRRTEPVAPKGPALAPRTDPDEPSSGGPNPLLVIGAAFAAGVLLAKVLDWRSHAHPRG
jgi:hypothetical protein